MYCKANFKVNWLWACRMSRFCIYSSKVSDSAAYVAAQCYSSTWAVAATSICLSTRDAGWQVSSNYSTFDCFSEYNKVFLYSIFFIPNELYFIIDMFSKTLILLLALLLMQQVQTQSTSLCIECLTSFGGYCIACKTTANNCMIGSTSELSHQHLFDSPNKVSVD